MELCRFEFFRSLFPGQESHWISEGKSTKIMTSWSRIAWIETYCNHIILLIIFLKSPWAKEWYWKRYGENSGRILIIWEKWCNFDYGSFGKLQE